MASPRVLPALVLVPCVTVVGIVVGGAVGRLVATGDGWDQLADALGGAMLGALGGLALAVLLVARLGVATLRRTAWVALALALLGGAFLTVRYFTLRPDTPPDGPPGPTTRPVAPSG